MTSGQSTILVTYANINESLTVKNRSRKLEQKNFYRNSSKFQFSNIQPQSIFQLKRMMVQEETRGLDGAMTFSIKTFSIATLSIKTFSIMTLSITTLSKTI